jgi:hypothetical protein
MNPLRQVLATAGWGVYCASSWTWCIGMFLPVILLQRYGWWGFLVFAIPNVIGCAAFGYVLRSRERSQQLVQHHTLAMRIFSLVTIAYHVFFLGFVCWLMLRLESDGMWLGLLLPICVVFLALVLTDLPHRWWPVLAVLVYGISLAIFATIGLTPLLDLGFDGQHPTIDALWLAPVIVFGFLLCPYLDLTFHRAIQQSPSRHAFAVFGICFGVMIVFTCTYWDVLNQGISIIILAHVVAQSTFTVCAHMREVRQTLTIPLRDPMHHAIVLSPLAALGVVYLAAFWVDAITIALDNYLRFLVFYGLLFPAYVLLFMGQRDIALNKPNVMTFSIMMVAMIPLYEAGFLHGQAWLLVAPPLVLLVWWAKRRFRRLPELQHGKTESMP